MNQPPDANIQPNNQNLLGLKDSKNDLRKSDYSSSSLKLEFKNSAQKNIIIDIDSNSPVNKISPGKPVVGLLDLSFN